MKSLPLSHYTPMSICSRAILVLKALQWFDCFGQGRRRCKQIHFLEWSSGGYKPAKAAAQNKGAKGNV
jgi:hypothetical protein